MPDVGVHHFAKVDAQLRLEEIRAAVDLGTEGRPGLVKASPHLNVLCALPREHEHNGPIIAFLELGFDLLPVERFERALCLGGVAADEHQPLAEVPPADLKSEGDVREVVFYMPSEVGSEPDRHGVQCRPRLRR